jgi:hypothetical protein
MQGRMQASLLLEMPIMIENLLEKALEGMFRGFGAGVYFARQWDC